MEPRSRPDRVGVRRDPDAGHELRGGERATDRVAALER